MHRAFTISARIILLATAGIAAALLGPARAATVSAGVDPGQVAVGESIVLSVEVGGTQNAAAPVLVGVDDFRTQYMGPSTQMRFENGRTSKSITHRFQLFPRKPGRFTLGPFDVVADGETLRTEPVIVQVVPRGAVADATGAPRLRLDVRLAKKEPFVGERVPLTIRLLVPNGVRVDDLHFPVVEGTALTVGDMPQPTQRDERVNGRTYRVLSFDTFVIPRRPVEGDMVVVMEMSQLHQSQGGRRRGVFGMFGDAFSERRPVEVRSDPVRLSPRRLPKAGRPAGFNGAVGLYDLKVSASPMKVNAGDPVTVRVEVSGDGDLTKVRPPRFKEAEGFRIYDPVAIKEAGADRRAIEQVVIPQSPDITELPTLSLSFFDPTREAYRTIHQASIPLQVAAVQGSPSGVIAQGDSGRAERAAGPIGRDIVYIKSTPGEWRRIGGGWFASLSFWLVNLVPALAVAALWWRNRRDDLLAANPRLRRFRSAEAGAREALSALSGAGTGGVEFVDGLSRVLTEYLGSKLDLPPGAGEGAAMGRAMRDAGYEEPLSREVEGFLAEMEGVRYSAGAGDVDHRELLRRVEKIVDGVERRKDLTEKLAKAMVLALALVLGLGGGVGTARAADARADVGSGTEIETSFFAGNHAYADGRYSDAVERYRESLAGEEESGEVHFNLGNAFFKQGQAPAALASYLRARRLLPRDPDVAANLSFAEESLELGEDLDPLWQRIAFPLAYRATEAELAWAWTILWWLFCGSLAGMVAQPRVRETLYWPIRVTAVVAALVLANLLFRSDTLELWNDAVVIAPKGAVVRFEPSADGTEHFQAPAGTRLEVDQEREGWTRVSRRDGRRGWVESDGISRLR